MAYREITDISAVQGKTRGNTRCPEHYPTPAESHAASNRNREQYTGLYAQRFVTIQDRGCT